MSSENSVKSRDQKQSSKRAPKLRFPEFQNKSATWDFLKLAEVLHEHHLKSDNTSQVFSVSVHKGLVNQIEHLGRSFAATNTSHYNLVKPFDVVYTKSPTGEFPYGIVKQSRLPENVIVSPLYGVFEPINSSVGFLVHSFFESPLRTEAFLEPLVQKGAKNTMQISNDRFLSGRLWLPQEANEQEKVACFLSTLDELIAADVRELDALRAHKKGLMQQLFPCEGETQPRMRFPEFQSSREWGQQLLGDIADVLMCKRIFANETNPTEGVPFYKIGTLGGVPDAFISQELFEDYKRRYNYPRLGEVLITCSGTVGKCLPYDGRDAYFQDSNIVWIDNPTLSVSNQFLLSVLSDVDWSSLNSTTIARIYGPDLRGLSIKYPQDHLEQQQIADCLTSLNNLITATTQELETLKAHKSGLMQQLFPAITLDEER